MAPPIFLEPEPASPARQRGFHRMPSPSVCGRPAAAPLHRDEQRGEDSDGQDQDHAERPTYLAFSRELGDGRRSRVERGPHAATAAVVRAGSPNDVFEGPRRDGITAARLVQQRGEFRPLDEIGQLMLQACGPAGAGDAAAFIPGFTPARSAPRPRRFGFRPPFWRYRRHCRRGPAAGPRSPRFPAAGRPRRC